MACVIVDGYNVLPHLFQSALDTLSNIEEARGELLEWLKEYRAFSGQDVMVVYDAHQTKQPGSDEDIGGVRVIFTAYQETADERIERLVYELRDAYRNITVATSDLAEQQVAFGGGALRISSREFAQQLRAMKQSIRGWSRGSISRSAIHCLTASDRISQRFSKNGGGGNR
ncbi:hypothetical protein GCM10025857_18380 [Alicyclobacillus contaminans]|nr:hypothetical protein GCM10025857_18380 [Alicyclobacillus contaminans]